MEAKEEYQKLQMELRKKSIQAGVLNRRIDKIEERMEKLEEDYSQEELGESEIILR